jgi:hypothetical protein
MCEFVIRQYVSEASVDNGGVGEAGPKKEAEYSPEIQSRAPRFNIK